MIQRQGRGALVSREELYRLVWSEPMTRIARRFDVSGSYMARVCTVLNVPRPERGYWAKLEVGKAPPMKPLPEHRPGDPEEWSRDGQLKAPSRPAAPVIKRKPAARASVPKDSTHTLIRGAKPHFENSRSTEEGAWLKPYKKLLVDITVSRERLDRALELANELFNAFEDAGHRVIIAHENAGLRRRTIDEREVRDKARGPYYHSNLWSPGRPTVVYIGEVAIGLTIVEMSETVTVRYVNGKYVREADHVPSRRDGYCWTASSELPSGRFRVIASSPYSRVDWSMEWQETAKTSLRSLLKSIVTACEKAAQDLVAKLEQADREAEVAQQKWLAEQERRARAEDLHCVERSFEESREELKTIIAQWSRVTGIGDFLIGVERRASALPDAERAIVLERLARARAFLGSQDPLDFFLGWKTPEERYSRKYPEPVEISEAG